MLPQHARHLLNRLPEVAVPVCCLIAAISTQAADVELRVDNQISATADFRPGKSGKPALLILHGFLQTRDFGIIKTLRDELTGAGYTVLAPNLSLGISYRKNSLSCEALHLHDMDGDIREIQHWMQWLRARGYAKIVGLGHSFGATQLLAWQGRYREKDFDLIGISLASSAPLVVPATKKTQDQKKPQKDLMQAPLSFCEAYTAPASKYASYSNWNDKRILAALKSSGAATDIILGSEDNYLPPNWEKSLSRAGAKVHLIKGANHFMEGTQEFDMFETTLNILRK
jgi:predicted alpha/beta-fold hydrolase